MGIHTFYPPHFLFCTFYGDFDYIQVYKVFSPLLSNNSSNNKFLNSSNQNIIEWKKNNPSRK